MEIASVFTGTLLGHVPVGAALLTTGLNLAEPFWNVLHVIVRVVQSTTAAVAVADNPATPIVNIVVVSQFVRMISFLPLFVDRLPVR
jgi:hypothetical protein